MPTPATHDGTHWNANRLARRVLSCFVFTFIIARSFFILMRVGFLPDFYIQLGETHLHHLNYGIFLLSGVGAYLLFARPSGGGLATAAMLYGIGLGLTFDEFGMWLHLEDVYWQRTSFDAVVVIAAMLGLAIVAPAIRRFRFHHWIITLALAVMLTIFGLFLLGPIRSVRTRLAPFLSESRQAPTNRPPAARPAVGESGGNQPPAGQPPAGPSH